MFPLFFISYRPSWRLYLFLISVYQEPSSTYIADMANCSALAFWSAVHIRYCSVHPANDVIDMQ